MGLLDPPHPFHPRRLPLEYGRELVAIYPEEEEREDGDNAGHRETALIKKDMIEHNVHDHRAEQR